MSVRAKRDERENKKVNKGIRQFQKLPLLRHFFPFLVLFKSCSGKTGLTQLPEQNGI